MRLFLESLSFIIKLAIVAAAPYVIIFMCGFTVLVAKWLIRMLGAD